MEYREIEGKEEDRMDETDGEMEDNGKKKAFQKTYKECVQCMYLL